MQRVTRTPSHLDRFTILAARSRDSGYHSTRFLTRPDSNPSQGLEPPDTPGGFSWGFTLDIRTAITYLVDRPDRTGHN